MSNRGKGIKIRHKEIAKIVLPASSRDGAAAARARLKGSVLRYDKPLDPVLAPEEWDMNR